MRSLRFVTGSGVVLYIEDKVRKKGKPCCIWNDEHLVQNVTGVV